MINRFRKKNNFHFQEKEIQITPFIDVVLVLLIIFMITSPAVLSGIEIDLPSGEEKTSTVGENDFLTITVSKGGKIYLEDSFILNTNLIAVIKDKIGNITDKTIFVRGDKNIKYGDIMNVVDTLNKAGYKKTILVTNNSMN